MSSDTATPSQEERIKAAVEVAVDEAGDGRDLLAAVEEAADQHGIRHRMGEVYTRAREEADLDA